MNIWINMMLVQLSGLDSFYHQLNMGGYVGYVWTSVGAVIGVLSILYVISQVRLKKAIKEQERTLLRKE